MHVPTFTAPTVPSAQADTHPPARRALARHAGGLLVLAWLCGLAPAQAASQAALRLTLLDGEAQVLQGSQWGTAVQGQALTAGTVLHTGPRTGLLRVEWPDQTALDLGPDTRVMLLPTGFRARQGRWPLAYVLRGWVKLSGGAAPPAGGLLAPQLELLPPAGQGSAVVMQVQPPAGAVQVFAENSAVDLLLRPSGANHGLPAGAWFDAEPPALPRPAAAWLAQVPRAFRDAIPRRAVQFKDSQATASPLPTPAYGTVADWLALTEPELRRQWPVRLAPWLQDPAFRRALQNNLPRHPEWGATLAPAR